MGDFYYKVKRSRTESDRRELLVRSRGDQSLRLRTSPKSIFIKKWAVYRNGRNGKGSLEYIFCSAGCRNIEIPFICLIDERSLIIHRVFHGTMGTFGDCFWQQGKLLERSFTWAEKLGLRAMLGHTHPKHYGAVCSEIRAPFKDGPPHGEDYLRIRWFMYRYPKIVSKFHIIMTPRNDQIGVFELLYGGGCIYHPVKYIE